MSVLVRKMRAQDLPRVLEILAQWNMVPLAPSPEIPHPDVSEIVLANAFVAETEGRIVGCCSYFVLSETVCETASFAVDRDFTGRGVGFALHTARLTEMKRRGVRRVITETDRLDTLRWYLENFPYRVTGTHRKRHPFGDPGIEDETTLELDLGEFTDP